MKKCLFYIFIFLLSVSYVSAQVSPSATSTTALSPEIQALYNQALNLLNQNSGSNGIDSNTGLPNGLEEQVSIKTTPNYPKPGEEVLVSLESYSTNLDKASITWTRDGVVISSGKGIKQIKITAPDSNESDNITATIKKSDGGTLSSTVSLSPSQVEIIYEAQTYTPPFYKGNSLFTSQSSLKFVAIPNFFNSLGQKYQAKDLIYEWTINGEKVSSVSGVGKNIFYYQSPIIQRTMKVGVNVLSPNSNLKANDVVEIKLFNPQIVLYENNPLFGTLFEKATLGEFFANRDEIEISAVPFFFNTNSKSDYKLTYKWTMNGKEIEIGQTQNSVVFRNETGATGKSSIAVTLERIGNLLQISQNSINLNFEENSFDTDTENNENFDF